MRVFVSGTSRDLRSFREAAAKQLTRLGAESVEQDYFAVDHVTLPALLKKKVKDCDAVICLIGSVFGAAPPDSRQSYTQMEYELAQEYQIPTFLFFPSPKLADTLAKADESPDQREWQQRYKERFQANTQIRYDFNDENDLCRLISEAWATKIAPRVAAARSTQTVRTTFASPFSLLYEECIDNDDALRLLIAESLRFICLLALHDSLASRSFGSQSADRKERSHTLRKPESLSDWHSLMRLACQADGPRGARFIPEFGGWERRNGGILNSLLEYEKRLGERSFDKRGQVAASVREAIRSLITELDFLGRYVLLAVRNVDVHTGAGTATLLRGLEPRSFAFVVDAESPVRPQPGQLYLLNVDRQLALCMTPAMRYESSNGVERVYGWRGLTEGAEGSSETHSVTASLETFDEHDRISIAEQPATLGAWLGDELCREAFGFDVEAQTTEWSGRLFDADSWKSLQEVILPAGGRPSVIGERFRLGNTIHRGFHADVFDAIDIAATTQISSAAENAAVPARPVLHVLRADGAADREIVSWFENRSNCWRMTAHDRVLRLYDWSDPSGSRGLPFLLTERVPEARSLDELKRLGEPVEDDVAKQAVMMAAQVCTAANDKGIFLLVLPARHFLLTAANDLSVTGFETATTGAPGTEVPASFLKNLSRFSKDAYTMAPEMLRGSCRFSRTLDVFAIGRLLATLRELPSQPMDVLPVRHWNDPWRCLTFHCLASDPNVRFQATSQIMDFIEWPRQNEPQTVAVPGTQTEPGFAMGKYPITNAEYERFCSERGHARPPYLTDPGRQDEEQHVELSRRLGGPWMPVTYVSLVDAEKYCRWLGERTGRRWRLPTEAEWLRAARSDDHVQYPWGNEPPDRSLSNYGPHYRGPTVVGTFPTGRSHASCMDMAGNVWEWCTDMVVSGAPRRVVKGGAYDYSSEALQLVNGDARLVTCRSPHVGFRVLCED